MGVGSKTKGEGGGGGGGIQAMPFFFALFSIILAS